MALRSGADVKEAKLDLRGKRVLVLGGSGVLGSLIARELIDRGAVVTIAARDNDKLNRVAGYLGGATTTVQFDLTVANDNSKVVEEAVSLMGGLDGIVNAAGVVAFGPLAELDDDALERVFLTDLIGPLQVIRAALPHLEGGFVVNLTGVVAESPVAQLVAYSAAKAGLSAASTALTRELRRTETHILDVRPPHTETGLAGRAIAGDAPRMPEGLDPETVAAIVVQGLADGRREIPASKFQTAD